MENPYRNEKEIILGGVKILLRPNFENMAAMESKLGGVGFLAFKFAKAFSDPRAMPPMSDISQIIYFNQAATKAEDPTQKFYSLEEVHGFVMSEGLKIVGPIMEFISRMAAGNAVQPEPSDTLKKSS